MFALKKGITSVVLDSDCACGSASNVDFDGEETGRSIDGVPERGAKNERFP